MNKEKKYFADPQTGFLNSDDSPMVLGENSWVNAENVRTGTTDDGFTGTMEGIGGTRLISDVQPSVTFLTIGAVSEEERNRTIYFKFNTTGTNHKIVCFDKNDGVEYNVLLSSQVTKGLNFSKYSIIHSAKIIDGMLYWPDSTNNQPRKINIDSGIKGNHPSYVTEEEPYSFPLNFYEITLIKPPPPLAPNIQKSTDGGFENNFIYNESYMFAYQYVSFDNELTVLGTYSPSSRLNRPSDNSNRIAVTMDAVERIPGTVMIVRLVVRISNTNDAFVVKTWDKRVPSEETEIENQNSGTQVLTYNFYGNIFGEQIPSEPVNKVLKPSDSVPIYSETLERAGNKLFLGNNTEGYDKPATTSLSVSLLETALSLSSLTKLAWGVRIAFRDSGNGYSAWYVYLTEVTPLGWYQVNSTVFTGATLNPPPPTPPPPTPVAIGGLTFKGATQSEVIESIRVDISGVGLPLVAEFDPSSYNISVTGTSASVIDIFPSLGMYKAGVAFYDFALRKCSVVTNDNLFFEIPPRGYAFSSAITGAVWSLSNSNAVNEIPDWACYYAPLRTLNLITRGYVSAFTDSAKYATKNADGTYQFTSTTYITGVVGIGLNTNGLVNAGLGYVYTEGDVCVLTRDGDTGTTAILPVIGQDGNYIIVKAENLGDLSSREFIYKIYTPYQSTLQEPFFEIGQMCRVLNPGESIRAYETLSDVFLPDSYAISRVFNSFTYFAEGMSPNDLYYKRWDNDGGKINIVSTIGQVVKTGSISFSNNYIPNTQINGLNTFDALDEKSLPLECGPLRKLQITSKVQDEIGIVMLAICEREAVSIYVGEVQQYGSNRATNLVVSDAVLGTINVLKGSFGTISPESVTPYRGRVFWADAINQRIIQYDANGLGAISDLKMVRFWKQFFAQYTSMSAAEIEALGGRPFIFTTVDPYHDELLLSVPKLLNVPPKGYLPDYPSTIYPFDIWDGRGKTIVYKLEKNNIPPRWKGSYSFNPEYFITLQNELYSFRQGHLYLHNQTTNFNNFYGVQYPSKIMFVSNMEPLIDKVYNNITLKSNLFPSLTYLYSDEPFQQTSDLMDFDYTTLEGLKYATFYRNKLIPTAEGYTTAGLLTGTKMRSQAMYVMLQFDVNNLNLQLDIASIGFDISRGHKI